MEWTVGDFRGKYAHKVETSDDSLGVRVTCRTCGELDVIVADSRMAHTIMAGHRDQIHAQREHDRASEVIA